MKTTQMAFDGMESIDDVLNRDHYLGAIRRGRRFVDENGIIVISAPTSRRLPVEWIELSRWCLVGVKNGGSKQWSSCVKWIEANNPSCTTVVSYSDPSVGHTGALYRACNWLWAPTWHRLQPPPTGNGTWDGKSRSAPKDRWVFTIKPDPNRERILSSETCVRWPQFSYREPTWKRGRPTGGGGSFKLFIGATT